LTAAGFTVHSPILYDAEPAQELPSAGRAALESGKLDGVLFFSPRTAATFVSLVANANLTERCQTLNAYCLSPAVANAARSNAAGVVPWRNIRCAVELEQESVLNLLADS
jgi:uroporphyrinogen-III synthase